MSTTNLIQFLRHTIHKIMIPQKILRCFLYALIPSLAFYLISLFQLQIAGFETMQILRDPAQQTGESSWIGFLSNIGTWLWVSSTAICFFVILASFNKGNRRSKEFILLTGTLSLLLAVDDFFMIHDRYINQNYCFLAYAIFASLLLIRHFRLIIETEGFAFLLAGVFLALSIVIDFFQSFIPLDYDLLQLLEEGFKFVGGAIWLYFNGRAASQLFQYPTPREVVIV